MLTLDDAAAFLGPISGFASGDTLDLTNVTSVTSVTWNSGVLTVSIAGGSAIELAMPGNLAGASFSTRPDDLNGTAISIGGAVNLEPSILDATLSRLTWSPTLGGPVDLTYSFMTAAPSSGEAVGFQPIPVDDEALVTQAIQTFSAVANIKFTLVPDGGPADIMFGEDQQTYSDGLTYPFTGSGPAPSGFYKFTGAHVYFATSLGSNFTDFWLVLHELGNAVGIRDFSGDSYSADSSEGLPQSEANFDYTVMANNFPAHGNPTDATYTGAIYPPPFSITPQILDVQAIQYLYGANITGYTQADAVMTLSGLVYTFNSNNDDECIWVGAAVGGVTTFDFSASTGEVTINLNPGSFSSTGVTPANAGFAAQLVGTPYNNISIAYGTTISIGIANNQAATLIADSTVGQDDVLVGGAGNDSFTAGGGGDIFIGGGGVDSAIFHDSAKDYVITHPWAGVLVVTDTAADPADGVTVLAGDFTALEFADTTIAEASSSISPTVVVAPAGVLQDDRAALQSLEVSGRVTALSTPDLPQDFSGDGLSDILLRNTDGAVSLWVSGPGGGFTPQTVASPPSSWRLQGDGDFNGDGRAGLLWRDPGGDVQEWVSNPGQGYTGWTVDDLGVVSGAWTVQGVGDFDGSGLSDILWRNADGTISLWFTTPGGGHTSQDFGGIPPGWTIQGVGDFNDDGKADILWRNGDGEVSEWLSNPGPGFIGFDTPDLGAVSTAWTIEGVADFTGDGLSDILWRDADGTVSLWFTTPGGGHTSQDFGGVPAGWSIEAVGDYNGDGKSDILWLDSDGEAIEWLSNPGSGFTGFTTTDLGTAPFNTAIVGDTPAAAAVPTIPVVDDFTGQGLSDILWRNSDGTVSLWFTTAGGGHTSQDYGVIPSSWTIQGVGDFNGDGKADILWRNSDGDVSEWLSEPGSGASAFTTPDLGIVPISWVTQGVGDFTGAGLSDILWRNNDGTVSLWFTTAYGGHTSQDFGIAASGQTIEGIGDFNGDGKADILWRNSNGDVSEWLSNPGAGFTGFSTSDLGITPTAWAIQGVGDFTGAGLGDILWLNSNGTVSLWFSTAGGGHTSQDFGGPGAGWAFQTIGDYNGDGKADILWRNTSTGDLEEWQSNAGQGFTGFATIDLGVVPAGWSLFGNTPPALQGSTTSQMVARFAQAAAASADPADGVIAAPLAAPAAISSLIVACRPG